MANCIFCGTLLDGQTKPEHVLLDALGGRKTTTQIICSKCNSTFGGGIDKILAEQFQVVRNLLQLESGTGRPAPTRKKVRVGTDVVNIHGDGTLELASKPFTLSVLPDGGIDVQITARSLEHFEQLIPHIAAAVGVSEEEFRSQLPFEKFRYIQRRPGMANESFSFGGHEAFRSAAKACLILWALKVGRDEVSSLYYAHARDFVVSGSEDFLRSRTALDARLVDITGEMRAAYGPIFNLIYIRSNSEGRVVAHFTFYNIIGFQIVLAESGGLADKFVALVSNPIIPSDWSDKAGDIFNINFDWLDRPEYYDILDKQRERFASLMDVYYDIATQRSIKNISDKVFVKYDLGDDDPIPGDLQDQIISELGARLAAHALDFPYEEPVPDEVLRSLMQHRCPKSE